MKPCQWLTARALVEGETSEDSRRKELVVPVYCVLGVLACFWFLFEVAFFDTSTATKLTADACLSAAYGVMAAALLPAGVYVVRTKRITQRLCEYPMLACAVAVVLMDLGLAFHDLSPAVSLNVLVLDCLLVCNCSTSATKSVIYLSVVWALVRSVLMQENVRQDDCFNGNARFSMSYCSAVVSDFVTVVLVLLVDFKFTRGFATSMRHQMDVVQAAIDVTEAIAQQLSKYEVEEGRALLECYRGDTLPAGLKEALHRLLDNLQDYRPYLPDAMLFRDGDVDLASVEPPGLRQDEPVVTMCFTDIQSSTELWEKFSQSMHTALQEHDKAMRGVAAACGGYEVKVIGDAFMLAFKTAEDACRFGLEVQVALSEVKWPTELLQHPLCTPVAAAGGAMLWNGPRVRIGVNSGAVRVEKNPVTGRCDYFGPTVNTAAKAEANLRFGGLTGVTKAVLEQLPSDAMRRLGDPVLVRAGARQLKGVAVPVEVTVILDRRLEARAAVLQSTPHAPPLEKRSPAAVPAALEPARADRMASLEGSLGTDRSYVSSSSSGSRWALHQQRSRKLDAHLREGLSRRPATCATFRARADTDLVSLGKAVAEMLETVEQAADLTQGVVVATVSVRCVVVWNGPRLCADHCGQCLRASDYVRRSRSGGITAGACSGELLHGNVAGARRKHSTVVGGAAELSSSLAEAAEEGGEGALAAAAFALYCSTQGRARGYAEWKVKGGGALSVVSLSSPPAADEDRWERVAVEDMFSETLRSGADGSEPTRDVSQVTSAESVRTVVLGTGVWPEAVTLS